MPAVTAATALAALPGKAAPRACTARSKAEARFGCALGSKAAVGMGRSPRLPLGLKTRAAAAEPGPAAGSSGDKAAVQDALKELMRKPQTKLEVREAVKPSFLEQYKNLSPGEVQILMERQTEANKAQKEDGANPASIAVPPTPPMPLKSVDAAALEAKREEAQAAVVGVMSGKVKVSPAKMPLPNRSRAFEGSFSSMSRSQIREMAERIDAPLTPPQLKASRGGGLNPPTHHSYKAPAAPKGPPPPGMEVRNPRSTPIYQARRGGSVGVMTAVSALLEDLSEAQLRDIREEIDELIDQQRK